MKTLSLIAFGLFLIGCESKVATIDRQAFTAADTFKIEKNTRVQVDFKTPIKKIYFVEELLRDTLFYNNPQYDRSVLALQGDPNARPVLLHLEVAPGDIVFQWVKVE